VGVNRWRSGLLVRADGRDYILEEKGLQFYHAVNEDNFALAGALLQEILALGKGAAGVNSSPE